MNEVRALAGALLLHAAGAAAQTLPQVTVTPTRIESPVFEVPASVNVIEGQRLRDAGRPELQLSESMAILPGVTARDRQNYAQDLQLSIRGFGARSTFGVRGVRLYVDGIPATMPDGQGQLSHFDLSSAGRVEVLRGPFSALYGNSSGGVLQLFTEPGEGAPAVTTSLTAGSDGLLRPAVRASGAAGALGYNLSASHTELDGWRDHSEVRRDIANARLDWKAANGGAWMLSGNTLDLKAQDPLGLGRAQFEADPRGVDPVANTFNTRKTVKQSQLGLVHEMPVAAGHTLRLMAYGGERETVQFQAIPAATQANRLHAGGVIDLQRSYGGVDARWVYQTTSLELVGGLAYDRMEEDRRGFENFVGPVLGVQGNLRRAEDNTATSFDPYVQGVWKPTQDWTLTAGARHSQVKFRSRDRFISGVNGDDSGSVSYSEFLPVAGVSYAISPQLRAFAAAGRGFETPTLNEISYRPSGAAGLNLALRPSRSTNLEFGLKGRALAADWPMEWTAAVFQTNTQDEIVTQTNSGGRSTFQNAGDTRRHGVELGMAVQPRRDWIVQFAHTWLDASYKDAFRTCAGTPCTTPTLLIPADNRIPGTARVFTAAEIAWRPPQGWRTGFELRRSGRVFVNDANTDSAPAWWTAATHLGYLWTRGAWIVEGAGRIDNLFDRDYAGSVIVNEGNARFFEPAPGRQFSVKLSATRMF